MGTEGGDKCVDNVDKLRKKWWGGEKGDEPGRDLAFAWGRVVEKGRIRKRSATSGGGNVGRATLS